MFIPQTALFHLAMIDPPSLLALRHVLLAQRQAWLRRPPRLALLRAVMHRVCGDTDLHARFIRGVQTGQLYQSPEFRTVAAMQPVVFDEGETITASFPDGDALLIVAGRLEGRQYNHYQQQHPAQSSTFDGSAGDAKIDPREAAGAAIGVNPAHAANMGTGFAPFLWPPLEDVYFATRNHQVRTATRVEAWRVPRRWITTLLRSMGPRLMSELEAVLYVMFERSAGQPPSLEHAPVIAGGAAGGGRAGAGGSMAAALLSNTLPSLEAFAIPKDRDTAPNLSGRDSTDNGSARPSRATSARRQQQPLASLTAHVATRLGAGAAATSRPRSTTYHFPSFAASAEQTPLPSPVRTRNGTLVTGGPAIGGRLGACGSAAPATAKTRAGSLGGSSYHSTGAAVGDRHRALSVATAGTSGPVVGSMGAAAAMKERAAAAKRERDARIDLQRQEREQLKIQAENQKLFARASAMAKEAAMRPPVTSEAPVGVVSAFKEAAAIASHNAARRQTLIGVAVHNNTAPSPRFIGDSPRRPPGAVGGALGDVGGALTPKYSLGAAPASHEGATTHARTQRSKSLADFGVPEDGVSRGPAPPAVSVLLGAYLGVADGSRGGLDAVGGVVGLEPTSARRHRNQQSQNPPPSRTAEHAAHVPRPPQGDITTAASKHRKLRVDISELPQFGEVLLAAARAAEQPGDNGMMMEGQARGRAALRHVLM
jgi:hypothetical protein